VAPPDSQSKPPQDAAVEQQLEQADAEDTGRGLEFVWLNAEAGYQLVGLQSLSDSDLVDGELIESNQQGLVYGVGAGLRIFVLTVGVRGRFANYEAWRMWSLDAEAGLRVPLANLELFFSLGAGYVSVGGFSDSASAPALDLSKLSVSGFDVRALAGVEYYLSDTFSAGLNLSGDLLVLSRSALAVGAMTTPAEAIYGTEGSGVGAAFTATAMLGLHF
jgi:hypothetical protein